MDPFNEKLAKLAIHYSLQVKPKQTIAIQSPAIAEDLCLALYKEAILAGAYPIMNLSFPGQQELFLLHANDDQLKHIADVAKMVYETYDHLINVNATSNSRALEQIDPKKMQMANSTPERAELMETFMKRLESKELHWILIPYPCHALAQDAGFGINGYKEFITKALALDKDDPVAYWQSAGGTRSIC